MPQANGHDKVTGLLTLKNPFKRPENMKTFLGVPLPEGEVMTLRLPSFLLEPRYKGRFVKDVCRRILRAWIALWRHGGYGSL